LGFGINIFSGSGQQLQRAPWLYQGNQGNQGLQLRGSGFGANKNGAAYRPPRPCSIGGLQAKIYSSQL